MPPTYRDDGSVWNIPAAADKTQGEIEDLTDLIGVWLDDVANGATGALSVRGTHTLPKNGADTFAVGAKCYLHASGAITSTPGTTYCGRANKAAGAADTFVDVDINAGQL